MKENFQRRERGWENLIYRTQRKRLQDKGTCGARAGTSRSAGLWGPDASEQAITFSSEHSGEGECVMQRWGRNRVGRRRRGRRERSNAPRARGLGSGGGAESASGQGPAGLLPWFAASSDLNRLYLGEKDQWRSRTMFQIELRPVCCVCTCVCAVCAHVRVCMCVTPSGRSLPVKSLMTLNSMQ